MTEDTNTIADSAFAATATQDNRDRAVATVKQIGQAIGAFNEILKAADTEYTISPKYDPAEMALYLSTKHRLDSGNPEETFGSRTFMIVRFDEHGDTVRVTDNRYGKEKEYATAAEQKSSFDNADANSVTALKEMIGDALPGVMKEADRAKIAHDGANIPADADPTLEKALEATADKAFRDRAAETAAGIVKEIEDYSAGLKAEGAKGSFSASYDPGRMMLNIATSRSEYSSGQTVFNVYFDAKSNDVRLGDFRATDQKPENPATEFRENFDSGKPESITHLKRILGEALPNTLPPEDRAKIAHRKPGLRPG